jgi:hypothetical protein
MSYDNWKITNRDDETLGPDPEDDDKLYKSLFYKYSHVGCPAVRYEDNCDHPGDCAEFGRCLELALVEKP